MPFKRPLKARWHSELIKSAGKTCRTEGQKRPQKTAGPDDSPGKKAMMKQARAFQQKCEAVLRREMRKKTKRQSASLFDEKRKALNDRDKNDGTL
jgi:hypothetical protein